MALDSSTPLFMTLLPEKMLSPSSAAIVMSVDEYIAPPTAANASPDSISA